MPSRKKRPTWPWVVGGVLLLLVIVIGSTAKSSNGGSPATVATTAPAIAAPAAAAVPTLVSAPAAEPSVLTATSWTMPNLVGRNLQDAQDAIQALTGDAIFLTKSHDATGAGRHQILDEDWKVCSQNVRAGTKITVDALIDFAAAKLGEHC